jgi:nucleoside-diphosphate kinase
MMETTLVLVKPDAVERKLVGEILRRFEAKDLRIVGLRMLAFDTELARRHYRDHVEKAFYPPLEKFITSGPSVAVALQGEDAIAIVRKMMGATSPLEAAPGTIRGDFALSTRENLVHGSDSPEAAQRELAIFFPEIQGATL